MPAPRTAALLAVVIWGMSFIATKTALREVSPITILFSRFAIGTLVLTLLIHLRGSPYLPPREDWPALALMGFIGVFLHHMLQASGLTLTTAINTGWLIGVIPIWSAVLAAILLKERFGLIKVGCLIGGFAGVLLVITKGRLSGDIFQLPSSRGDFLILLSTVTWAVYSVVGHATIKRLGAARATAGAMLFGWLMLAPIFLARQGWRELPQLSWSGWGAILFLGIACSALGYLFWYGAIERIEVSRVASFLYIEPLVTLMAAMLVLNETVSAATIIGGVVVLVSVFVMQHAPS